MHRVGIVKTVFVRKHTVNGKLNIKVPLEEANLSRGRWRICISQLILTPYIRGRRDGDGDKLPSTLQNYILTVSLSSNQSHLETVDSHNHLSVIIAPSRVLLCLIPSIEDGVPFQLPFVGHWMEIERPTNEFFLAFHGGSTDDPVPDNSHVQAIILLERIE
jgi:hypothetical protein